MGFINNEKLEYITENLVKAENIKVASHRGHTLKNVVDNITRECENVSTPNIMTLENRVNKFRVGKGRDVDMSSNVHNCMVNLDICGKTYHNLLGNVTSIIGSQSCDVTVLDINIISFEATYKNNKTGNTPVNRASFDSNLKYMLKPNTDYTFIYKYTLLENPNDDYCMLGIAIDLWGSDISNSKLCRQIGFSDINVTKARTPKDVNTFNEIRSAINFINKSGRNTKWQIDGLIVLEGDHTQTPINEISQYFTGIKSSFEDGIVDVEVYGKNLFDGKLRTFNINNTYIDNIGGHNNGLNNIPVKPNTNYVMTFETPSGDSRIIIWDGNKEVLSVYASGTKVRFKTPLVCDSLSFYRSLADYTEDRLNYKIQIEEGIEPTHYEPYYKKKISFDIGDSLRSLPNGVCDEIRNNNGQWELVRRIGKTILDGQNIKVTAFHQYWSAGGYYAAYTTKISEKQRKKGGTSIFVDTLPVIQHPNNVLVNGTITAHCCWAENYTYAFYVAIDKSYLESNSLDGVNKWLRQNPTTVYYELETPTIELVEPLEFDIKPSATMNIKSDISPVSKHTVVLNRAGQIEQGIIKITELRQRVSDLEEIYASRLIDNQLKLSKLALDYELEKEE